MRLIEVPVGHSLIRTHLTIKPKKGIVYEVIGTHPHPKKEPDKTKQKSPEKLQNIPKSQQIQSQNSFRKKPEKAVSEKEKINSRLVNYLQSEMKKKK